MTVAAAVVCAFAFPAMPGAGGPNRAEELRREGAELTAKSRSAVLELYAIDSRLARARTTVTSLRTRTAAIERQQATTRNQLSIARRTITASERLLASRLRALYEQGETDALAIVLGASSLNEAVSRLDGIRFAADTFSVGGEVLLAAQQVVVDPGHRRGVHVHQRRVPRP